MYQAVRFISVVVASLLLTLVITVSVFLIGGYIKLADADVHMPDDVNVLVVGNSQPANAINDTILANWRNLAYSGFRFCDIPPALDLILTQNPQIDTVVMGMTQIAICRFPDKAYFTRNSAELEWYFWDVLLDKGLLAMNLRNPEFFKVMLLNSPRVLVEKDPKILGEFIPLEQHYLAGHHTWLAEDMVKRPEIYTCTPEDNNLQFGGFLDVIDVCRRHGVACVMLDTPRDDMSRYYHTDYYRDFLSTLDPDIPVADYSNFQFPDSSYFGDAFHINHSGARYLSEHIRDHGLETIPIADYIKQPGQIGDAGRRPGSFPAGVHGRPHGQ